jgi:hypothetical protein
MTHIFPRSFFSISFAFFKPDSVRYTDFALLFPDMRSLSVNFIISTNVETVR